MTNGSRKGVQSDVRKSTFSLLEYEEFNLSSFDIGGFKARLNDPLSHSF